MSGGVKKIVSVVAAIAIPFAAPAIASSIGLSAAIGSAVGSATAGAVIGSALTGAALGAVKGAVLGEDVGRSALYGGIGGGVSGYFAGSPTSSATNNTGGVSSTGLQLGAPSSGLRLGAPSSGLPTSAVGTNVGLQAPFSPTGLQLSSLGFSPDMSASTLQTPVGSGFVSPADSALATSQTIDYGLGAGLSPTNYSLTPGMQFPTLGTVNGLSPSLAPELGTTGQSIIYTPPNYDPTAGLRFSTVGLKPTTTGSLTLASAESSTPSTFTEALKQVPSAIADKFKDPKALADMTLRAGAQLAGSMLAGENSATAGLSPEERMLLDAQTEELRQLQKSNQALFNQRLEQAQALIGESKYFDPEYFGLQSARRIQLADAKAKRAGLRGLTGDRRAAEARRYDLATARDTGTAFDVGYSQGVQGRLGNIQAGLQALPSYLPSNTGAYSELARLYATGVKRNDERATDIGWFFGDSTGTKQAESRG